MAVAIGAVLWLYHPNKAQSLTPSDTVVLADFANATGDPAFDNALRQALSAGLAQSPFFNILPEREVSDTLQLMRRSPDDAVDERTGVEICERTQSKGVFAGSIAALGSQYVLGLKVLNCRTGDVL